jgi:hypothetical protein
MAGSFRPKKTTATGFCALYFDGPKLWTQEPFMEAFETRSSTDAGVTAGDDGKKMATLTLRMTPVVGLA